MAQTHIYHRFVLVWSPVTPRHFAWQAWHNLTSTFVLRGRRGTTSQLLCHNRTSTVVSRGRRGIHGTVSIKRLGRFSRFTWQAWCNLTAHTPSFTKLCRIPSFTHNFVTHHLSHTTLSHTTLSHTTLSHTTPLQPQLQLVSPVIQRCGHTHHLSHTTLSHTTPLQPQLQLVSQVRLVICIQRCSHRIIYCCSGRFGPKLFAGTFTSLRLRHVFCSELFLS